MIADMVKRRIDIVVEPIVVDAKRWRLFHFPRIFYHGKILFYTVRKPSRRAGAFIRVAPMTFFAILFLSMVTCALGFCLINYCSGRGLLNGIQDVVLVLVSTAMLFSYPVPERFQRVLAGRIVLFCWTAGGFSLVVYFQSLLTSSLSSGYVWDADDTIEKLYPRLASGKLLPCVVKGIYFERLLLQVDDKQGIIGVMAAARRRSSNKDSTVSDTINGCMEKVLRDMVKRSIDIVVEPIVVDAKRWRLFHFPIIFYHGQILFYTVRKPSRRAGTIVSPILFGSMIDLSCVHWQTLCQSQRGACTVYENASMSCNMYGFLIFLKTLSVLFFFAAWLSYRPVPQGSSAAPYAPGLAPVALEKPKSVGQAPARPLAPSK
ncbi:hypothetical protein HPB47_026759 [Ixodes persulcatus]|uniref:Uncharacterized protein n=1 Tax=Ixodes persulcatus TaxID=34615 RepID=A0AC60PXV9_IXOPE|nr:hypothetical protein HPB47_026759 [Ixodes persulcatus]